jgi:hypothetical protein
MVVIERRFRGPGEIGNGGYCCGLLAKELGEAARATLRKPVPLETPLCVEKDGGGKVLLRHGETILGEAEACGVELNIPEPASFEAAAAAAREYLAVIPHIAPECFVCGPERAHKDGLRIFAGAVAGRNVVAAAWSPDASLADESGDVRQEFLWAALDCPGYYAAMGGGPLRIALLGQLAARVERSVKPGERCVVMGWGIEQQGRKHVVGTAAFDSAGELVGAARGTWIEVTAPFNS